MERRIWFDSPLGPLTLTEEDGALTALEFGRREGEEPIGSPLLAQATDQLTRYFSGELRCFSIPLRPKGTPFQQAVWQALCRIPYGQTCTYQQVAAMVGSPKGCRAVGMACHRNPIGIVIPCHRVVGKNNTLTGYAGGLWRKQQLLSLEQRYGGIGYV